MQTSEVEIFNYLVDSQLIIDCLQGRAVWRDI